MAKPVRTFSANVGQKSVETAGPDQIEHDLDQVFAMFDPAKTLPDGTTSGGLSKENVREGIATLNASGQVEQDGAYSSGVSGFTPTTVKAALDALAGVRIVEMGSNSNGEYVRWENGLQIATGKVNMGTFSSSTQYQKRSATWTFPASFTTIPIMAAVASYPAEDSEFISEFNVGLIDASPSGGSQVKVYMMSIVARFITPWVSIVAIGRWK